MNLKNNLEKEGFELIATVNNYYPKNVKSSTYTFKTLYFNPLTNEIKATSKTTQRSETIEYKEISLEEIKVLNDDNPVKVALKVLESEEFHNNNVEFKTMEIKKLKLK